MLFRQTLSMQMSIFLITINYSILEIWGTVSALGSIEKWLITQESLNLAQYLTQTIVIQKQAYLKERCQALWMSVFKCSQKWGTLRSRSQRKKKNKGSHCWSQMTPFKALALTGRRWLSKTTSWQERTTFLRLFVWISIRERREARSSSMRIQICVVINQ